MKTNQRAVTVALAIAASMAGAGITLLLTGEAGWLKFAAWTVLFVSMQGWLFLPPSAAGRWCAVRLPRRWRQG